MRHVQMEPGWGGSSDTAVELRAVCAMGLASTTYPNKLRELVNLLVDREWQARAGAVRAIAAVGSDAAALLLRFKALSGDKEPEVLSECFSGLLAIEGAEALPLVNVLCRGTRSGGARSGDSGVGRQPPCRRRRLVNRAVRGRRASRDPAMHSPVAGHVENRSGDRVFARRDPERQCANFVYGGFRDGDQPRRSTDSGRSGKGPAGAQHSLIVICRLPVPKLTPEKDCSDPAQSPAANFPW